MGVLECSERRDHLTVSPTPTQHAGCSHSVQARPQPSPSQQLLTVRALVQAVDPKSGVHLLHLSGSDLGHRLDGVHAAVLRKGHGDDLQGVGKRAHGVLLQGRALEGTGPR